jgi:hypothetical protein
VPWPWIPLGERLRAFLSKDFIPPLWERVKADKKKTARLNVIRHFLSLNDYDGKDAKLLKEKVSSMLQDAGNIDAQAKALRSQASYAQQQAALGDDRPY